MKYKIMNDKTFGKSVKDVVLENRGLTREDVEKLLNPPKDSVKDPFEIYGMKEGIKQFKDMIEDRTKKIAIACDSDNDGMASSSMFYRFLVEQIEYPKENIDVLFHEGKQHGLNSPMFKEIWDSSPDYVIVPDAGTNDLSQMKKLDEKGIKVLCLDHHQLEIDLNEVPGNTVIINNQIGDCPSKHGSGTFVTSKFIQALGYDISEYMDIIGISLISDSMELRDIENRFYTKEGLSNIENKLVKSYLNKARIKKPTINDISFNLVNYINAVIRVGKQEDKELMFKAMCNIEEEFDYKKKDGSIIKESIQDRVVRESNNAKSRQNNSTKKMVEKCNSYIGRNNLINDKVIIIKNDDNFVNHSVSGLVCMKVASQWKRPCIILNKLNNGGYSGSCRTFGIDNFKTILDDTNLCEWNRGHLGAFGTNIKEENIDKLRKELNIALKDVKYIDGREYQVDDIIDIKELNKNDITSIAELTDLWCQSIVQPLFCIRNISIDSINIKMPYKLLCTFKVNGINFNKNWCSKDFFEQITCKNEKGFGKSKCLKIDIVGKFVFDKYGNPVVEIIDANSRKDNGKIIF